MAIACDLAISTREGQRAAVAAEWGWPLEGCRERSQKVYQTMKGVGKKGPPLTDAELDVIIERGQGS